MPAPLDNVRVLDLTRLLPGAIATLLLSDMGADVIKVEDPHAGDYARWTPPLVDGLGAFFRASNRNKRSMIINLKHDQGRAVLYKLAESADVLIEGFRPGVTQRLGVDYDTLRDINPGLVYCSLSGWGQTGPYAEKSGHDLNYVALNSLLGGMKSPQPLGGQIADVGGSYISVMGVLAALFQRQRTGQGQYVDVSLFESAIPFALYQIVESVVAGMPGGAGSLTGGMAFYDVYQSRDNQPLAFAPIEPKFWHNFCQAVGKMDWLDRHSDPSEQAALKADLQELFSTRDAAAWDVLLSEADCCFTLVTPPENIPDDPQIQARGTMGRTDNGVPWLRSPLRLSASDTSERIAPESVPGYGEHTREILQSAGYTEDDIAHLMDIEAVADKSGGSTE
jgi:crotonobetainyl-CoA:carnitine CoA-transferase CaiB-like acyl-CoA transferase